MKKSLPFLISLIFITKVNAQTPAINSCNNLDFASGSLTNWVGKWNNQGTSGTIINGGGSPNQGYGNLTVNGLNSNGYNDMGYVHEICTGGVDRNVPINMVPAGHTYSLRLGDDSAYVESISPPFTYPYNHQTISNTFNVTTANTSITYWYAVVLAQAISSGHPIMTQPYFSVQLFDGVGNKIPCTSNAINPATAFGNNFNSVTSPNGTNTFFYNDWSAVTIPLLAYVGQTVTITFETSDCANGGHFGYAYLAVDCGELTLNSSPPTICNGVNTLLSAPTGFTHYNWDGPGIVGSDSAQAITINQAGTYSVTLSNDTCHFIMSTTVNNCVTTGLTSVLNNRNLSIYPNPSNGNFVIETNFIEKQTMQVYDVNGRIVLSQNLIDGKANVDATILSNGIYNVSLISNTAVTNKRMVIAK